MMEDNLDFEKELGEFQDPFENRIYIPDCS
jgi:hypothetical protein